MCPIFGEAGQESRFAGHQILSSRSFEANRGVDMERRTARASINRPKLSHGRCTSV